MIKDYQSTFSINQDKYYNPSKVRGFYIHETGHGIIFLDVLRYHVTTGEKFISWIPDAEDGKMLTDDLKQYFQNEQRKNRALRKYRRGRSDYRALLGEQEVLMNIIRTDFHEYIHHFLQINNIPNNCCENHDDEIDSRSNVRCWLCDFTRNLRVRVEPTPDPNQHPELLVYIGESNGKIGGDLP